jgi:uncharacterized Zn finger protein
MNAVASTARPGATVLEKAERIVAEGRIQRVSTQETFEVQGDSGTTYKVTVFSLPGSAAKSASCNCPAQGPCKHALGVAMFMQREGKS